MNDLKFAFRQLLKNPGFTAVAVLTLVLGFGANTAMFIVFNGLLFRPVPVGEPETVVRLHTSDPSRSSVSHISYPDYRDLRDQSTTLAGLAASSPGLDFFLEAATSVNTTHPGTPEKVRGVLISGTYFALFGGAFSVGRGITPADDQPQTGHSVVVLSHRFWSQRFGADPAVVGQTIRLNGIVFTVVGVSSPEFRMARFGRTPDVWLPLTRQPGLMGEDRLAARDNFWLQVDGRLKTGVSLSAAQAEIDVLAERLAETRNRGEVGPLALTPGTLLDPEDRQKLVPIAGIVMAAVGFIVLIAGANLANLLLSRALSRGKEFAVRMSLGASRGRMVRQLITESSLLGALGAGAGLLVAWWLAEVVVVLVAGAEVGSALELAVDWRVLSYVVLLFGLTVFGFGLVPALQTARQDASVFLKNESPGNARVVARSRMRSVLIGGQVALSLILLVTAALLIRTLQRGLTLDTGLEIDRTISVSMDLARHRSDEPRAAEFHRRLIERLSAMPNVRGIAQASAVPLSGVRNATDYHLVGGSGESVGELVVLAENEVSANFFEVLGIAIARGRTFTEQELQTRQPVALVTEGIARRLWPGESPLGKRLRRGTAGPEFEIVGIVQNTSNQALYEDEADVYLPLKQDQQSHLNLLVRTTDSAKALPGIIAQETRAMDASLWPEIKFLADQARQRLRGERTMSWLASGLGLVALALAVTGLYGVLSWLVGQRAREMGIRMALGARPGNVTRLVVGQGLRLIGVGAVVGLLGAAAMSRVLKGMIYDLSPVDPLSLSMASGVLFLVALLICWLPARRAAKFDPISAMRAE